MYLPLVTPVIPTLLLTLVSTDLRLSFVFGEHVCCIDASHTRVVAYNAPCDTGVAMDSRQAQTLYCILFSICGVCLVSWLARLARPKDHPLY